MEEVFPPNLTLIIITWVLNYLPNIFYVNIWLILVAVETWHSTFPASEAFVNLNFKVFWPLLNHDSLFLTKILFILPPWYKLKSLIIVIFFITNEERIAIRRCHQGNLQLILLIKKKWKSKQKNNNKNGVKFLAQHVVLQKWDNHVWLHTANTKIYVG